MEKRIGIDNNIGSAHMVLGRDLNPHDTLFAGRASEMIIECGFMEAMDFLQTKHIVCQGLDGFRFLRPKKRRHYSNYQHCCAGRQEQWEFIWLSIWHRSVLRLQKVCNLCTY